MKKAIKEQLSNDEENTIFYDGFDDAIIGLDLSSYRIIYSVKKCIEILCRDMNEEDAREHFEFNVIGSYVGEKTPIFCSDEY
jgi:hypothetical protein